MNESGNLDRLAVLKQRFNPRREYKVSHTKIEVDGAFVRFDDDWGFKDDKAIVPLEDFLQDPAVIRSARVSTGRDAKEVNEKAEGLIGALYRNKHVTPFEGSVIFRLRVEPPICFAQSFFQLPF